LQSDPSKPRVIFPTAYSASLNREMEDALMVEAKRRLDALKTDLGWNSTRDPDWWRHSHV
jgi:hypothetical protein